MYTPILLLGFKTQTIYIVHICVNLKKQTKYKKYIA